MAGNCATRLVNKTRHLVKLQVGNNQHYSDLACIKEGGEHTLHANVNDTYREFTIGSAALDSKRVVVTSDDCCDFQCITIQEVAGELQLIRQPRDQQHIIKGGTSVSKKKPWFSWGLWAYYVRVSSYSVPLTPTNTAEHCNAVYTSILQYDCLEVDKA